MTTTIPVGNGIGIQGGLFVTALGTEIIPNPGAYNDNISRSYLFGFSIPFRHVGMLISYPIHEMVSISAGPVTGWHNPRDNNSQPSFFSAMTLMPFKNFSLVSSFIIGPDVHHNNSDKRLAWANVASYAPLDDMTLTVEYTYGREENVTASSRNATWQGVAGYVSYNWTERFNTAVRGEYFRDADGARFGGNLRGTQMDVSIGKFTLTGAFKFTEMLLGRVELRQDLANTQMFQKGNTGSDKNQTTFAM